MRVTSSMQKDDAKDAFEAPGVQDLIVCICSLASSPACRPDFFFPKAKKEKTQI